jgi:dihydroxy-acid dehydratase
MAAEDHAMSMRQDQPPLGQHHRRRGPRAQPLDVLRHGLHRGLRQADDRRGQRPQHHHALQLGPAALADAAVEGLKAAGANPQIFGTPTISDGMAMGTEGMKYSLVSREVIADCVETCVGGQWMDGVLVIGGCDKNMPGGMMGMLRANVPAIYVYGGTILPGKYKGQDLNIVSVFEAVGQFSAGKMSEEDFCEIERRAIPGSGSCGGMYTANTMSSAFEALGMSLPYASTMANVEDPIVAHTRRPPRCWWKPSRPT